MAYSLVPQTSEQIKEREADSWEKFAFGVCKMNSQLNSYRKCTTFAWNTMDSPHYSVFVYCFGFIFRLTGPVFGSASASFRMIIFASMRWRTATLLTVLAFPSENGK